MSDKNKIISAQVILNPEIVGNKKESLACVDYFRDAGFEVGDVVSGSFPVSAPIKLFEKYFCTGIATDENGTHIKSSTLSYELPLECLHAALRRKIQVVTFSTPPDFGPEEFF